MLKWCIVLLWTIISLNSCSYTPSANESQYYTFKQRLVPLYDQIIIRGAINVRLYTDSKHPRLALRGDAHDLQHIHPRIIGHALFIEYDKTYTQHGIINVEIHAPNLHVFKYFGAGTIEGRGLHTRGLRLYIKNSGPTILNGQINLQCLVVTGTGSLKINGLSAYNLQIIMRGSPAVMLHGNSINLGKLILCGKGNLTIYKVQNNRIVVREHGEVKLLLAGNANVLDLELWNKARFNGRYLTVRRAFVKTRDHSIAGINVVKVQHTLASDASDIYFYNLPDFKNDFMSHNGAVLDMRTWESMGIHAYTPYNKH